ncbi:MAG: hypothetical protein IGS39_17760 [Calothrix sp. C42_A2020_038]|nr:hypothetical protein [Calothrix sp. C42_A2020_038]
MNNWYQILLLSSISIYIHLGGCAANSNSADSNFAQNPQSLKPVKIESHGGFFACKVYSKDKQENSSNSYYYFPAKTESQLTDQDFTQIIQSNQYQNGIDYFSLDKQKYYERITIKDCQGLPTSLHESRTEIVYIKDNKEYEVTGWMLRKSNDRWTFINPLQRLN